MDPVLSVLVGRPGFVLFRRREVLKKLRVSGRDCTNKLEERGDHIPVFDHEFDAESMGRQMQSEDFWQIVPAISKADRALARAIASGEPAHVARYAFQLAEIFNSFYHGYPVLQEPDPERRTFLLWMTEYFRQQLERTLGILGIAVPPYM